MQTDWAKGEAVTGWMLSDMQSRVYPGTPRPMPDLASYRFQNGWVDTGDLPCREALRQEVADREVVLPDLVFGQVYIGDASGFVAFSDFCHEPEWRVRHCQLRLNAPRAQTLRLRIETAGAVHLWLDGALVHRFEPFTRNEMQTSEFDLPVCAGDYRLTLRAEDLHERDTVFGFRLTLLEGEGLSTRIDLAAKPAEVADVIALLDGLRSDAVLHSGRRVRISSDALADHGVDLRCLDLPGQGGRLSMAAPWFDLDVPPGCRLVRFEAELGGVRFQRSLGLSVFADAAWLGGDDFDRRADAFLARHDCGDDIARVLVALKDGRWEPADREAFHAALTKVEARHDCADFRMMALLWIWDRYRQNLPAVLADRLRAAILSFRYWMDEPGNDVMWFWSENHALCFHIAQHLAGQMLPDATFTASGRKGADQAAVGAARLDKWFDAVEAHGLVEWNSAAYYPINYRGLLALYTLTRDARLRARAGLLLERLSQMVALHTAGGVAAGTQGRMYEKELFAGPMTELGALAALMFGGWHVPGKDAPALMLALSDYRPNVALNGFAKPAPGATLGARYQQGAVDAGRLSLFKSRAVQMSSVGHHKPGQAGHQQHVVDVQYTSDPLARIWINHPGTLRHWAEARPSYWAGNGRLPDVAQDGSTVALLYALQKGDIPFTHLFLPVDRFDAVETGDHWIFLRAGEGYGAIWSAGALTPQTRGAYQGYEWRQQGPMCAWVVQVGDAAQDGSFAAFKNAARAARPGLQGWRLRVGSIRLDAQSPATNLEPLPVWPGLEVTFGADKSAIQKQDELI